MQPTAEKNLELSPRKSWVWHAWSLNIKCGTFTLLWFCFGGFFGDFLVAKAGWNWIFYRENHTIWFKKIKPFLKKKEGKIQVKLLIIFWKLSKCHNNLFHLAGIRLAPKEKLEIPVLFMPAEMKIYKAVVVIHVMRENGENWPYVVRPQSNKNLKR